MKVCAYVMTYDTGLAPNPFHGVCTLAVCTPNHQNANLGHGDIIVGIAGTRLRNKLNSPDQWRLVYAMEVDKRRTLDEYFGEYKSKRPKLNGSKIDMCGDNFYKNLTHTRQTEEHTSNIIEKQDCDGNRVFVGSEFAYFGSLAPVIPTDHLWGAKLIRQLTKRAVGVTYILGGTCADPWNATDLDEFRVFISANKPDYTPDPIDFDLWKGSSDENISKSRCA